MHGFYDFDLMINKSTILIFTCLKSLNSQSITLIKVTMLRVIILERF